MDNTNLMLTEGVASIEMDWRTQLPEADRRKVVSRITEVIMKNPSYGLQQLPQIENMASRFEEKIFSTATSKEDYRRKISLKLLPVKTKTQQSLIISSPPDPAYSVASPPDPAYSVESSIHQAANPRAPYHVQGRTLAMQPGMHQHPQIVKKPHLHQGPVINHPGTLKLKQPILTLQQQQQNAAVVYNQLNGHQISVPDFQSQHQLFGQNYHSGRNLHQLSRQVIASTLNGQPSNFSMCNDQCNMLSGPKTEVEVQQQAKQTQTALLQIQGPQSGKQPPHLQLMSQMHMQPGKLHPQTNTIQRGMQKLHQTSASLLMPQHLFQQKKQTLESQNNLPVGPSMVAEGTSQARCPIGDDWKEELFQKIQNMKDLFVPELKLLYAEIAKDLHKFDSSFQDQTTAEYDKLKRREQIWKKVYSFLHLPKLKMSEDVGRYLAHCKRMINFLLQNRTQGSISSLQQEQLPTSDAQSLRQPLQLKSQHEQQIVKSQMPNRQIQQRQMTAQLMQPKEERELQHCQQSAKLMAHHCHCPQLLGLNQENRQKVIQGMGTQTGTILQNQYVGHNSLSNLQLVKSEPAILMWSPQLQTASCQISHNSSTYIDQKILEKSSKNLGNNFQSPHLISGSPPSTSSVRSPIKVNQSKFPSHFAPLANIGDIDLQATSSAQASDSPFVISTAGLSPSVLLVENEDIDVNDSHTATSDICESAVPEEPIQRLINATRSMSYNLLSASVGDMESVLGMVDRTAGQIVGNGSESAIGEDLVAANTCWLRQKLYGNSQRMKRSLYATAVPSSILEPWSFTDGLKTLNHLTYPETSHLESAITTHNKKPRIEVNCTLLKEITAINQQLIETVVEISHDDVMSATAESVTESSEGTIVRCSFNPVTMGPNTKSELARVLVSPIMPLRLLIPINYPDHSPIILDKLPTEFSMDCEDLSAKSKLKLIVSLRILRQPMSLGDIARTWDACARAVLSEYAEKLGGGNFSSRYGTWKSYPSAA